MLRRWRRKSSTVEATRSTVSSSSHLRSMSSLPAPVAPLADVLGGVIVGRKKVEGSCCLEVSIGDRVVNTGDDAVMLTSPSASFALPCPDTLFRFRFSGVWGGFERLICASLCRLSMSMTLSTVQKAPVRPQPAEQCTSMGRTLSAVSGLSCHDRGAVSSTFFTVCRPAPGSSAVSVTDAMVEGTSTGRAARCMTLASSTRASRWLGWAGAPKSGHDA